MNSPEQSDPRLVATDNDSPWLREIHSAWIDATRLSIQLSDGCELRIPLSFFPTLELASDAERQSMQVHPHSLSWESLDCDLGIEGLLQGWREDSRLADKARRRFDERQAAQPANQI